MSLVLARLLLGAVFLSRLLFARVALGLVVLELLAARLALPDAAGRARRVEQVRGAVVLATVRACRAVRPADALQVLCGRERIAEARMRIVRVRTRISRGIVRAMSRRSLIVRTRVVGVIVRRRAVMRRRRGRRRRLRLVRFSLGVWYGSGRGDGEREGM